MGIGVRLVAVFAMLAAACGGDPFTQGIAPLVDGQVAADGGVPACVDDGGCDAASPPRADAESDAATADGACAAVRHNNGFADFYDCNPTGGYSAALAMDACETYFGHGKCALATCDSGVEVVQAYGQACIAWAYGGSDARAVGHAREGALGGSCVCPGQSDTPWY